MNDFSKLSANETPLLSAETQCDCQNNENFDHENGHEAGESQCKDGVCALNWKPLRPAA